MTLLPFVGRADTISAAELRRNFHEQGFKTDLSDFNFTVSKEMSERADALTIKGPADMLRPISFLDNADLLTPVGDHAAIVVWKQGALAYPLGFRTYSYLYDPGSDKDVWPLERDLLDDSRAQLDSAAAAALSGPFAFNLNANNGVYMLLPHLPGLRHFSEMFAGRTMVALHDHDQNAAWTNLLAVTRIVTGWQVEPAEVSQTVRFGCLQTAYEITWQALQADWPDARLAQLQKEWESLDVFKPLPETVAFNGASYVELARRQDDASVVECEKALLPFYHDRELEMHLAIQTSSWAQIRLLPEATDIFFLFPPETNLPPKLRWQVETHRMPLAMTSGGLSLLGRAAEAEIRRRLIITAIALERFRLQHGSYPESLDSLAPQLLKTPPVDFANGQPLHYSLTDDGHFLLYSVGLDGKDDGGEMSPALDEPPRRGELLQHDPDIVWPLPAPVALADAHAAKIGKRLQAALDAAKQRQVENQREAEAARQAAIKELLNNPKYKKTTWTGDEPESGEPIFDGQPLPKLFGNEKSSGTNQLTLDALLTLRPVPDDKRPSIIAYQVPIAYDRLTNATWGHRMNRAHLSILMDSPPDDSFENEPKFEDCERATNGDCLLVWNPAFEKLGLHAIQAVLTLDTRVDHELFVKGPALAYSSTNILRFDAYAGLFSERGATLFAELAESNATFDIEIKTKAGRHVKSLTGSTTNGVIGLEWDLLDDKGEQFTNNSFISYFHVTLPRSGRSQTLNQWQNKIGTRGD